MLSPLCYKSARVRGKWIFKKQGLKWWHLTEVRWREDSLPCSRITNTANIFVVLSASYWAHSSKARRQQELTDVSLDEPAQTHVVSLWTVSSEAAAGMQRNQLSSFVHSSEKYLLNNTSDVSLIFSALDWIISNTEVWSTSLCSGRLSSCMVMAITLVFEVQYTEVCSDKLSRWAVRLDPSAGLRDKTLT